MKKRTKILLFIFLIVAIAQIWVPFSMMFKHSTILEKGKIVKMKLAPVDPISPFKGKYLRLTFEENRIAVRDDKWERNETIYLHYHTDNNGYMKIDSIMKEVDSFDNILKAKALFYSNYNMQLTIKYPFEKYFIEESKAALAEEKIAKSIRNKHADVYAEISILNSIPVLKEVYVDGKKILDFLNE